MILELFILLNCLTLKVSYYNLKERDLIIISNSLSIISKHHQGVPYLKMKTKIISIILLILIVPPILFCVLNSSYELYVNHQENIAYSKMQQAVDKHGYNAISLEPVKARIKFFHIYEYKSSFSNQKTLNKNRQLFNKVGYKIGKHDDLETPYKYSISALKSNGKWTVYIKEEPFGKEKSYRED